MRILIIEDETRIAGRIERMTRGFFAQKLERLDRFESVGEGLSFLEDQEIDVLLLDLNLNGEDGFTLLESVISRSFHTIVISAYTEKAITAFEYGVLDFVAKPFDENRLAQAFLRISSPQQAAKGLRFLAVKKAGEISMVDIKDLIYIKGAGIYSELHLSNGKLELHDKSLEKLEQLLPAAFERVHKSYIVAIDQCEKIMVNSGSKYDLLLKNGELIPVGRTRYPQLKEKLFESL
ncbi:LytTR family DNA-binding domain-containing protein [Pedobacter sp. PLR]|uniref:LytR/AlgR family response regulator transcription factor n=1 Tax=Pedobacter sp. PLR TaxID=2994465 RepID=UPI002247BB90|nr:LytTR family DNA-binding domain-containing protein [Pedobacter sp. PLR]MCX2454292.1 LytTR family DNA-binding domain-containing protein [Pedobacter sp. PLR]